MESNWNIIFSSKLNFFNKHIRYVTGTVLDNGINRFRLSYHIDRFEIFWYELHIENVSLKLWKYIESHTEKFQSYNYNETMKLFLFFLNFALPYHYLLKIKDTVPLIWFTCIWLTYISVLFVHLFCLHR